MTNYSIEIFRYHRGEQRRNRRGQKEEKEEA